MTTVCSQVCMDTQGRVSADCMNWCLHAHPRAQRQDSTMMGNQKYFLSVECKNACSSLTGPIDYQPYHISPAYRNKFQQSYNLYPYSMYPYQSYSKMYEYDNTRCYAKCMTRT